MSGSTLTLRRVTADAAATLLSNLAALLRAVVDDGASIGFLPPLDPAEALDYWQSVVAALHTPYRIMLVAEADGHLAGTVQLDLAAKANARHRAEVIKLMVAPAYRRRGIAQALMQAIEAEARQAQRTTLVLDTRQGDASEQLYRQLGYTAAGVVPQYAANGDGGLDPTVIYYKLLLSSPAG